LYFGNENHHTLKLKNFLTRLVVFVICTSGSVIIGSSQNSNVHKVKDLIIYKDEQYYSSFPSIVKTPNGEFLVAFRRAPNRMIFGESGNNHVDHNSYLVAVRSTDGENWTNNPELIYAHPFGGSQDPCMLQLEDGTILCTSYGWQQVR